MARVAHLTDHLAPDSVQRLARAAANRFEEAEVLRKQKRFLCALYLYGYVVEMCLTSAYFKSAGFSATAPIDRETRRRRMAQARQLRGKSGEPLMNGDPHPLVGWARFLSWQKSSSEGISQPLRQLLTEAIRNSEQIYKHWRPELRYKTINVQAKQLAEVRQAALWFVKNVQRL